LTVKNDEIRHLENLTAEVWPAGKYVRHCGWTLGFDAGVTSRANSVFPNEWSAETPLTDAIGEVERQYRAHGLAPSFKISEASLPQGLDDALAAAGYGMQKGTAVMQGGLTAFQSPMRDEVRALDRPTPEWCALTGWEGSAARIAIAERIATPCTFFLAMDGSEPVGTAIGVVRGEWAYISGLHVSPAVRGRGIGTSMLGCFAHWAVENGAGQVFLQVEGDNPKARALYDRLGLVHAYDYHYRIKP
jgi:N-acetylglutamate synthase